MNRKQKIIVSITGIFIVLLALVGLTYAYFLTQIKGNTSPSSVTVSTANLILEYGDGNGILSPAGKLVPDNENDVTFLDASGNTVTSKTFTVENKGNDVVDNYAVTLENFSVTYTDDSITSKGKTVTAGETTSLVYPETMQINIKCTSSDGGDCNGVTNGTLPTSNEILLTNSIDVGEKHSYTLTMRYLDNGLNQSEDMNKTISGLINIIDANDTVDIEGTVATYTKGDYVQINSDPKTSQIVYDEATKTYRYKIVGVKPDSHVLSVRYKDSNNVEQIRGSYDLEIEKSENYGVSNNIITINDYARTANIDIDSSYEFVIDEKLKGYSPTGKTLLSDVVSVGDYVKYEYTANTYTTPETSTGKSVDDTTQTFDSAGTAAITSWRVFSNKNGVVKLIGVLPDDDTKLIISGTMDGVVNGPNVLNEMSQALYSSNYATARSINIEDINDATGYDVNGANYLIDSNGKENGNYYYVNAEGKNTMLSGEIQTIRELESKVSGLPELDSTVSLNGQDIKDLEISAYTYSFLNFGFTNGGDNDFRNDPAWSMIIHKQPYWIASSCVHPDYDSTDLQNWTPRVQYSLRFFSSGSVSVRYMTDSTGRTATDREYLVVPIITLKSGLYTEDEQVDGAWVITEN